MFAKKFIGRPGVTCLSTVAFFHGAWTHLTFFFCLKELEDFWQSQRHTEWFRDHPILGRDDPRTAVCACLFVHSISTEFPVLNLLRTATCSTVSPFCFMATMQTLTGEEAFTLAQSPHLFPHKQTLGTRAFYFAPLTTTRRFRKLSMQSICG